MFEKYIIVFFRCISASVVVVEWGAHRHLFRLSVEVYGGREGWREGGHVERGGDGGRPGQGGGAHHAADVLQVLLHRWNGTGKKVCLYWRALYNGLNRETLNIFNSLKAIYHINDNKIKNSVLRTTFRRLRL